MSRRAWLTPDTVPETRQCWRVFVPANEEMRAAFRGALHLLSLDYNWEQYGTATPEACADAWLNANYQTFSMEPCGIGESQVPVGTIFWFPSSTPPTGALVCNGDDVASADYPDLYAVIGTTFGGDANDFNLPDLQNKFIKGKSASSSVGDTGGASEVTLTVAELPPHAHTMNHGATAGGIPTESNSRLPRKTGEDLTGSTGSGHAHENEPPYVVLVPMIQAE